MVPARTPDLPALVLAMSERIAAARSRSLSAISREMVLLYWELGRYIVEFEQGGEHRAQYGEALIQTLAAELTQAHGRGFSERNLLNFRAFYRAFPDSAGAPAELTWTHFVRLLRVENNLAARAQKGGERMNEIATIVALGRLCPSHAGTVGRESECLPPFAFLRLCAPAPLR